MPRTFTFHDIETLTVAQVRALPRVDQIEYDRVFWEWMDAQARNRDALYRDYDRVGTNLRGEIAR